MNSGVSRPSEPISVLYVSNNFKTGRDSMTIHSGDVLCLISYLIQEPVKEALSHQLTADEMNRKQVGMQTTYCEIVSFLLSMYATADVITEAEAEFTDFNQPVGMPAVQYFEALWKMALTCP